mmetsp:Transcript_5023/g.6225  ORF Transcript_5023/g.6225 Transcript_5023/m.6225 type:complete len:347 (-) Transcript_5023:4605-5645(-)
MTNYPGSHKSNLSIAIQKADSSTSNQNNNNNNNHDFNNENLQPAALLPNLIQPSTPTSATTSPVVKSFKPELSPLKTNFSEVEEKERFAQEHAGNDGDKHDREEDEDDDDDDDDDSENLYRLSEYRGDQNNRDHVNTLRDDDYEDDIQNLSDLHASDDEDDEEFDCNIEDFNDSNENNENNDNDGNEENREMQGNRQRLASMARRFTLPSSVSSSTNNYKWYPTLDKPQSQRKYHRNCLRCIKPLTAEDTWVNKSVVKPTTLSPISFSYLRNMKYANSNSSSSSSLASLGSQVFSSSYTNTQTSRKRSLSLKDGTFTLPDIALTRLPNHFLKEYLVGSHGLIPKEV